MQYLLLIIPTVFSIFFCFEIMNRVLRWEFQKKCCAFFINRHALKTTSLQASYFVSKINKASLFVFALLIPPSLYKIRGGYLVSFGFVERAENAELIIPVIFLFIGLLLTLFYISSFWHSLHNFGDRLFVIPLNPFKSFEVFSENLQIAKGTDHTKRGLTIYQIYNAEQDQWYYCLLAGIEELGLKEKAKGV